MCIPNVRGLDALPRPAYNAGKGADEGQMIGLQLGEAVAGHPQSSKHAAQGESITGQSLVL